MSAVFEGHATRVEACGPNALTVNWLTQLGVGGWIFRDKHLFGFRYWNWAIIWYYFYNSANGFCWLLLLLLSVIETNAPVKINIIDWNNVSNSRLHTKLLRYVSLPSENSKCIQKFTEPIHYIWYYLLRQNKGFFLVWEVDLQSTKHSYIQIFQELYRIFFYTSDIVIILVFLGCIRSLHLGPQGMLILVTQD